MHACKELFAVYMSNVLCCMKLTSFIQHQLLSLNYSKESAAWHNSLEHSTECVFIFTLHCNFAHYYIVSLLRSEFIVVSTNNDDVDRGPSSATLNDLKNDHSNLI